MKGVHFDDENEGVFVLQIQEVTRGIENAMSLAQVCFSFSPYVIICSTKDMDKRAVVGLLFSSPRQNVYNTLIFMII